MVTLSLSLIQEGQVSVTGESLFTSSNPTQEKCDLVNEWLNFTRTLLTQGCRTPNSNTFVKPVASEGLDKPVHLYGHHLADRAYDILEYLIK